MLSRITAALCLGTALASCAGGDADGTAAGASVAPVEPTATAAPAASPDDAPWPDPRPAVPYAVAEVARTGALSGQVTAAAEGRCVSYGGDVCPDGSPPDPCVVDPGPLAGAVVVVQGIASGAHPDPTGAAAAAVAVRGCALEPRVQIAPLRATLAAVGPPGGRLRMIRAEDYRDLGAVELGAEGAPGKRMLRVPGLIHLRLEDARAVRGWVWVAEHPYAALTDADGRFHIDGIPVPGDAADDPDAGAVSYTLLVWHEAFAERTLPVRVVAGSDQVVAVRLGGD